MKKVAIILYVCICLSAVGMTLIKPIVTEKMVRDAVLLLHSENGSCTGVQVKAPSGHIYTLTAAHCRVLLVDNKVQGRDEDGKEYTLTFIEEDKTSDLMLLSAPNGRFLRVGKEPKIHDHVHTETHGAGMLTYRTDGEILNEIGVDVPVFQILTEEDLRICTTYPKYILNIGLGILFGIPPVCVLHTPERVSTARIVPGSSGGPMLNESNELVGIASATDSKDFSYWVSVHHIKEFLKGR